MFINIIAICNDDDEEDDAYLGLSMLKNSTHIFPDYQIK